jgi:hypothetical protein
MALLLSDKDVITNVFYLITVLNYIKQNLIKIKGKMNNLRII